MKFIKLIFLSIFISNTIFFQSANADNKKKFSLEEINKITDTTLDKESLNLLIKRNKKTTDTLFLIEVYKYTILNKEYMKFIYLTSKNLVYRDENEFKKYTKKFIDSKDNLLKIKKVKISKENKKHLEELETTINSLILESKKITIILEFEKQMYKQVIEDGKIFLKEYSDNYQINDLVYKSKIRIDVENKIKK